MQYINQGGSPLRFTQSKPIIRIFDMAVLMVEYKDKHAIHQKTLLLLSCFHGMLTD